MKSDIIKFLWILFKLKRIMEGLFNDEDLKSMYHQRCSNDSLTTNTNAFKFLKQTLLDAARLLREKGMTLFSNSELPVPDLVDLVLFLYGREGDPVKMVVETVLGK